MIIGMAVYSDFHLFHHQEFHANITKTHAYAMYRKEGNKHTMYFYFRASFY